MLNTKKLSEVKESDKFNQTPNKSKLSSNQQNQQIQQAPQVVNNFNIINPNDNNKIIVEHDKDTNTFTFKGQNNVLIGTFTVLKIFKYLNKD